MSRICIPEWAYHRVDGLKGGETHYRNAFARYIERRSLSR